MSGLEERETKSEEAPQRRPGGTVAGPHPSPSGAASSPADRPTLPLMSVEERYRLLAEAGSDVVVRADLEGRAEWISPSIEALLGWRPDELLGLPLRELVAEEDRDRARAHGVRLHRGEPVRFDARLRRPDGTYRWLAISARPLTDAEGRMIGRVDGWRDIDEEVRTREALVRSEARFRLLAENSSDVVYLSGADGLIQWVSPSVVAVMGLQPEQVVGREALSFVHPDDLPSAAAHLDRVLRGETVIFQVRMPRPDGQLRWFEVLLQPVIGTDGQVTGRTGSLRDVTNEHDARSALEASERLYRSAMDALHDGVVVHDAQGRIIAASPSALRMIGLPLEAVLGRTVIEIGWLSIGADGALIRPQDHPAMATLAEGRPVTDEEMHLRNAAGAELWLRISTAPLRDAEGRVIGMVGSFADITEQRRRDAELRAGEERFRTALEAMDEGVVVLRQDGEDAQGRIRMRVEWANGRSLREWFGGQPASEVAGQLLTDVDRHISDKLLTTYDRVVRTGQPYQETLPFRTPDGERIIHGRMVPFPGGLLHLASDVTETATLTEQLRAGERRFRVAFEALDVGVAVLRPVLDDAGRVQDAIVTWANPMCLAGWFAGRSLAEVEGRGVMELDHDPERQAIVRRIYQEALDTGRPFRGEYPFRIPGTEAIWYSHRIVPFEGGLIHVAVDVSEAHAQRRALEEAHQLAQLGVWRRDMRTGEATWSDEMYRIFERDPALGPLDLAGASAMGGVPVEMFRAAAEAHAQGRDEWEVERELVRPDGRPFWIVTRTRAERGPDGSIVAYRGTTQDVTERRQAEQIRERFNQELEQRVADRTADLEAANEELRSFSYSLSHDLRAPLRSIAGFAGMLERHNRDQLDEEGRRRLANILTASESMGRVIDDLLLYLRLGSGAVARQPIDLAALVGRLRVVHTTLLASTDGRLELVEPAAAPLGDPTLLGEILGNLVENALHYRRTGVPPVVRITAEEHDGQVTVAVQDNGMGIDPAAHERIFEAFTRLAGDEAHPGTGIGLAVVRRAAHAMDTDVTVDSVVGEGSTFRVTLPAATGWYPQGDSSTRVLSDDDDVLAWYVA